MKRFRWQWILWGVLFFAFIFGVLVTVTMWLWNSLAVEVFGAPEITYWQTLGLMVLGRLLTGGFHKGGKHKEHWKHKAKWNSMSDEERKAYRGKWEAYCGPYGRKKDEGEGQNPATE